MSKSLGRSLQRVKGTTQQLQDKGVAAVGRRADGNNVGVRLLEESCTVNIWAKLPAAALNSVDVRKVSGAEFNEPKAKMSALVLLAIAECCESSTKLLLMRDLHLITYAAVSSIAILFGLARNTPLSCALQVVSAVSKDVPELEVVEHLGRETLRSEVESV